MARDRLIVGIDIGTTKMCTLIARVTEDEQLEVIGVGVTRSDALRKGVVVSVDQAAHDIQSSIEKAQQQSGFKILSAYVTISGSHLQSEEAHSTLTPRRSDRPISDDDVEQVLEATRLTSLPSDREFLEVIPRRFTVDGQHETDSPIGMLGHRLEVEATLLTGARSAIQNLTSCVERAGVSIDALVPQSLASGEGVLSPTERSSGVTLIDIGGGTTDVGVFHEGQLLYMSSLPVGGFQITNDIAARLRTPFSAAEEIKLRHGQAISNGRDEDRTIDVATFDSAESSAVSIQTLTETIEDRLADTLERVRRRLERAGFDDSLPAGAVLTGGTAQLHGIRRLAAEILESHVRIGIPSGVYGLGDQLGTPAFAASVGLLKWGLNHQAFETGGGLSSIPDNVGAFMNWLRGFLP
jgi:cell division protein FtsA